MTALWGVFSSPPKLQPVRRVSCGLKAIQWNSKFDAGCLGYMQKMHVPQHPWHKRR